MKTRIVQLEPEAVMSNLDNSSDEFFTGGDGDYYSGGDGDFFSADDGDFFSADDGDFFSADDADFFSADDGEFSEARGRRGGGRARRRARRAERRKARQQRRMERIKNRAERRKARRDMRRAALEDRLARRRLRKEERVARRAIGDEGEAEEEVGAEEGGYEGGEATDEAGYESQDETGYEEGASEEGAYEGGEEGAYEEDVTEFAGTSYCFDAKTDKLDEFYTIEGDDFFAMDAVTYDDAIYSPEDFANGAEDYFYSANGKMMQISPDVSSITKRIEWNKELVARMNKKKRSARMSKEELSKLNREIKRRQNAIQRLTRRLEKLSNKRAKSIGRVNAQKEVGKAKAGATLQRLKAVPPRNLGSSPYKALDRIMKRRNRRGTITMVQAELNPEITPDRIEIPAQEKSNMTGLNGYDNVSDYDAPEVRKYDVQFSSAEGSNKKKRTRTIIAVAAGIIVAGVVIYFLTKKKK